MKRFIIIFLTAIFVFSLVACSGKASPEKSDPQVEEQIAADTTEPPVESNGKKVLVAYFSVTGTTKNIAGYASAAMGGDLYEIKPAQPYTSEDIDYGNKNSRTTTEMNDPSCRPEISGSVENMEDYDIIFIGYPIWWGEAPRIVSTFIESYDFSGKTIVTFSTSGSSAHNDSSIKNLVSGVNWITGTRMNERDSRTAVAEWINSLGLDIKVN